jgi:tetratricopeptide (TPR) repeat protein
MTAQDTATANSPDDVLRQAKLQLKQGQLQAASSLLQQLLETHPQHREGLYYLAVCMRQGANHAAAAEILAHLISAHPRYGRAYQENGHNLAAMHEADAATAAFEKAVALNPALLGSWRALLGRYEYVGAAAKAEDAANHVRWLTSMPPQLQTVSSLLYEDKLYIAEQICRQFLKQEPHHKEAMRLLADIGNKLQILDDAEFLLESCIEFYPDYQRARLDYVQVLHKRQKFDKALDQAQQLHQSEPLNLLYEVTLAAEQQAVGNFDEALYIYDQVLSKHGNLPKVFSARGHALKTIGRTEDAIASYRSAYRCQPDYGDAYWSLANLKTYQFSDTEIQQMSRQEAAPDVNPNDRIHLCFALGKALEDKAAYQDAFGYYERGNRLKQSESGYKSELVEAELNRQKQLFDADFFSQRKGHGADSAAPIFVVGLPRAGSTLLEQILASHSQVDGTMELANIIGTANRLNGRKRNQEESPYPGILADLSAGQLQELGEKYIEDTRQHRQQGLFFVDKMPNNFRHIPLIQLILPHAKIIDARRHPMACCFSGFKQLFAEGQEFTYGLDEIGRYYRAYVEVMSHWDAVLPGRILRVQHEDVVADLEAEVRRILDYCELPFEQACVDFHQTERAVRTPSSEQVRQPIYQSATEQWTHFSEFLGPLEQALGPVLSHYRD